MLMFSILLLGIVIFLVNAFNRSGYSPKNEKAWEKGKTDAQQNVYALPEQFSVKEAVIYNNAYINNQKSDSE